jgi:hypothetical protein
MAVFEHRSPVAGGGLPALTKVELQFRYLEPTDDRMTLTPCHWPCFG